MIFLKQGLSLFLSGCLLLTTAPGAFAGQADQSEAPPPVQAAQQTPAQLQQLVAPIALYADALVAQVLAAATYPDQIVEANRWMQQHSDLKGEQLGQEVDKQPWDPSVKALTEFPSVLANMDKNLSWTSSLGDAYVNQQQQVMDAVQVMRERAKQAGNLNSTPRAGIRSLARVWRADRDLARLVWVSRAVSYRTGNCVWLGLWHRLLWRLWLGLAPLGIRLASPRNHVQPQHLHIPQQNLRQSQHVQSRACKFQSWRRIPWWKRISGPRPGRKSRVPWISPTAWICSSATRICGTACPAWWSFRRVRRL